MLRRLGTAQAVRRQLASRRPAPAVDAALLCTALALLLAEGEVSYNAFTVVDQAVEAAKRQADTRRQAAFVNACLRRFRREADSCLAAVAGDAVARWNHTAWWISRLQGDYPDDWAAILDADQLPAPMDLRVNLRRGSVAATASCWPTAPDRRHAAGRGRRAPGAPATRARAAGPCAGAGVGAVGDGASAPPLLLEGLPATPLRVLDACAAPGGKTAHLLECAPQARVTALELNAERSQRISDNLARLDLSAEVRVADAGDVGAWWDGAHYDAILLDAPCSASGIVRRPAPTCAGCAVRATSPSWLPSRTACCTRCGRCWPQAGACCIAPARCFARRAPNASGVCRTQQRRAALPRTGAFVARARRSGRPR